MLATGQPGETGAPAVVHVEEESGREVGCATTQHHRVEDGNVSGMRRGNQTRPDGGHNNCHPYIPCKTRAGSLVVRTGSWTIFLTKSGKSFCQSVCWPVFLSFLHPVDILNS